MVDEITTEWLLNDVGEQLYCDGDTITIHCNYDNPGYTFDVEEMSAALDALEAGARRVEFDDDRAIGWDDSIDLDVALNLYYDSGIRRTNIRGVDGSPIVDSGLRDLIDAATE